jgi:hypothetical protein
MCITAHLSISRACTCREARKVQKMLLAERKQVVKIKQDTDILDIKCKENKNLIAELLDMKNSVE